MCQHSRLVCLERLTPSVETDSDWKIIKPRTDSLFVCAALVFKPKTELKEFRSLNVLHPHPLPSRHRKLRVCFYLLHTIAALCLSYYSEEIIRQGEWIRVFRLWWIIACATGGVCLPPPGALLCTAVRTKVQPLICDMVSHALFPLRSKVWMHAGIHTAWQECHLLAGPITALGGCLASS